MKVTILGTRGIPNHHGGFEQFAEYFACFLAESGHDVSVYNSSSHPYKKQIYKGVKIIHCFDPEEKIGTVGQFIYDFNCILDLRKRNNDIILQLGYTSSSIWWRLIPKKPILITNMDGLEWKRSKYSRPIQHFLKFAEKLAVKSSDYLISDSEGIKSYLKDEFCKTSKYIAYGAKPFNNPNKDVLSSYNLKAFDFDMLVARLEPENNIEVILEGVAIAEDKRPFLVIGKHDSNKFGEYLKQKFSINKNIKFLGGIYDIEILNNLRYFSNIYFHGHSVGGTNPSLLEAMASKSLIVAHDNEFNKAILKDNAFYFKDSQDVNKALNTLSKKDNLEKVDACYKDICQLFSWEKINNDYLEFFNSCLKF